MGTRIDLQAKLESILGSGNVYFQPPASLKMKYPAIVYARDYASTQHADNQPWRRTLRYQVTVIDADPDSSIPERVSQLPSCTFNRFYTADNLNHDTFTLYF